MNLLIRLAKTARAIKGAIIAIHRTSNLREVIIKFTKIITNEGLRGIVSRLERLKRKDYTEWIKRYEALTKAELESMQQRQSGFLHRPLISVILPVHNPKPEWLMQAIESICQQIYPNWELCIADDASTDNKIRKTLNYYQQRDPRIKVVFRKLNGHIVECSNSALELAVGDWVALLDHDDLISPDALYWAIDAINKFPHVRMIYSDEDKIDVSGNRSDPYFKSDWNPDLFYSHNMFCHLGIYQADLLKEAGRFRPGFEGAQDYDLALRCIELINIEQIHHIPRVLYHWRAHINSTAYSASTKPYAMLSGERALNEYFHRCKIRANAKLIGHGYRIRYDLPENPPLVSIIIPTRNRLDLLRPCIQSIKQLTSYPNYEIIVIDNGSDDPQMLAYLNQTDSAEREFTVMKDDRPFNYSALNNKAVGEAKGEYITLLNNDVRVISPDWLNEMMGVAVQPGVGVVGAKLYYPDGTIQHAGIVLGIGGVAGCAHSHMDKANKGFFGRASLTNSFSAVTGACMVVSKAIFEKLDGFNEVYLPIAFNDVDFCLRVREAGYRNVFTPFAELLHYESASRGYEDSPEKMKRFEQESDYMVKTWSGILQNDPAYNPNLTLEFSDFSLAWPPRGNL